MIQEGPARIERRLSAILAADVAGYSRLMHDDEEATHVRLTALLADAVDTAIVEHGGRIVKNTGDGFLAEFPSAVQAVRAALLFQNRIHELTVDDPADRRILFRVGINIGDVIVEPHDIFGDDVNIAARLESIAESGGIYRDLHIHDFDAIRFVSGDEIVEVYADGSAIETPWLEQYGDVDVAAAVLRLAGGGLVILSGTRHDPLGYDVRLEVFGTKDSLVAGLDERTPLAGRPGPAYRDFWDRFEPAYRAELEAFVTAVRTGGKSACSLEEARSALRAALAADRSLAEHRPVALAKAPPNG